MKLQLNVLEAVIAFVVVNLALSQGHLVDIEDMCKLVDRFPYVVSLQDANCDHRCGGVLVDRRWILTAAQCVSPLAENSLCEDELIASLGVSDAGGIGEVMYPSKVIIHEKFDGNPHNGFDIALIRLDKDSLSVPGYISKSTWNTKIGSKFLSVEWGSEQNVQPYMQHALMTTLTFNECNHSSKGWKQKAQSNMLCVSRPHAQFCGGEAGTPLIDVGSTSELQTGIPLFDIIVGISSFGKKSCQMYRRPEVFTSLSAFSGWIAENIKHFEDELVPETDLQGIGLDLQVESEAEREEEEVYDEDDVASTRQQGGAPVQNNLPDHFLFVGSSQDPGQQEISDREASIASSESPVSPQCKHPNVAATLPFEAKPSNHQEQGSSARESDPPRCTRRCGKLNKQLLRAASKGDTAEIKKLLKKGADLEFTSNDGGPSLLLAAEKGHVDVTKILLDSGAHPDAQDYWGLAALIGASRYGHACVVELLLDAGAQLDIQDFWGHTALIEASKYGHAVVVDCLLDAGSNTDTQDKYGNTALMEASSAGHVDVVNLLLKAGASKKLKNDGGKTALDLAQENNEDDVVALLI